MRRQPVPSTVLLSSQCDCVGVHYDAVVGLASKVAQALYTAVVLTVRVEEFNAHPFARCKFHSAEEAHKAGFGVVNKHRQVQR